MNLHVMLAYQHRKIESWVGVKVFAGPSVRICLNTWLGACCCRTLHTGQKYWKMSEMIFQKFNSFAFLWFKITKSRELHKIDSWNKIHLKFFVILPWKKNRTDKWQKPPSTYKWCPKWRRPTQLVWALNSSNQRLLYWYTLSTRLLLFERYREKIELDNLIICFNPLWSP